MGRRGGLGQTCAHAFLCDTKGEGRDLSGFGLGPSAWMFALGMTFGVT